MDKAVLFDFDGVIASTLEHHVNAWNSILKTYGFSIKPSDVAVVEGAKAGGILTALNKKYNFTFNSDQIITLTSKKVELYNRSTQAKLYPGVENFIIHLKEKNFKIGLVTGSNIISVKRVTGEKFITKFDTIVTGNDVEHGKPHPESYLIAAQKLKIPPANCVVIENAPYGIQAAKAAGMFCIALTTTIKDENILSKADCIVESITAIDIKQIFPQNLL